MEVTDANAEIDFREIPRQEDASVSFNSVSWWGLVCDCYWLASCFLFHINEQITREVRAFRRQEGVSSLFFNPLVFSRFSPRQHWLRLFFTTLIIFVHMTKLNEWHDSLSDSRAQISSFEWVRLTPEDKMFWCNLPFSRSFFIEPWNKTFFSLLRGYKFSIHDLGHAVTSFFFFLQVDFENAFCFFASLFCLTGRNSCSSVKCPRGYKCLVIDDRNYRCRGKGWYC